MNSPIASALAAALVCFSSACLPQAQAASPGSVPLPAGDQSYRNELQHAIDRGSSWLASNQNSNGWWSTPDQPAVTALALLALRADPSTRASERYADAVAKGYRFLRSCAQPDGGIHRTNLPTYNTSLALMALLASPSPEHDALARKARAFLVRLQGDFGEKGKTDTVFDGGIGYGSKYEHSDMGNTVQALEAIYYSRRLLRDQPSGEPDLNWDALRSFLQNCQNLPSHNTQTWVSDNPKDKGGFVYYPGHSMAGGVTNEVTGKVALRSYGSISYAGMMSYIYADLKPSDPRVTAVKEWLRSNYTLQENPGMGPQGLFYYYHTMAKALNVAGMDSLKLLDGSVVPWRRELSARLLNLQQRDGSWSNDNARWWEKDASLVTSYGILTLSIAHRGL